MTNLGEDALKWDKDNGVFTAAHGTETTSKITNVKDGDLTTGSTDAVNGSQLKTTNDAVATNTTNICTGGRDERSRISYICVLSGAWFPCYETAALYCLCLSGKKGGSS